MEEDENLGNGCSLVSPFSSSAEREPDRSLTVEGLITIIFGLFIPFLLPDDPDSAKYLNQDEKALMRARAANDAIYVGKTHFEWKQVRAAFRDYKLWINCFAQFGADVLSFGFATFLPNIIKAFGFDTVTTQLLTVPVYFWAAFVYITASILSDRLQKRIVFMIPLASITVVGYIILMVPSITNSGVRIFALLLQATGIYSMVGLNIILLTNSQAPHFKRATAIGLQQTIGNCAGFVSGQIFLTTDAPRYYTGAYVSLGEFRLWLNKGFLLSTYIAPADLDIPPAFTLFCICLYVAQFLIFRSLNAKRDRMTREEKDALIAAGAEGDAHPDFRYPQ